jgi:hypothetical protein
VPTSSNISLPRPLGVKVGVWYRDSPEFPERREFWLRILVEEFRENGYNVRQLIVGIATIAAVLPLAPSL